MTLIKIKPDFNVNMMVIYFLHTVVYAQLCNSLCKKQ